MFIANDKAGNRVSIEDITSGEQYYCPICGKELIIKAKESLAKATHFAHKSKCTDTWKYDMSEWHLAWQNQFPKECREVTVEKNGIKHRADVLINNTVIEFQHSPIKGEEIEERNNFYLSCGYQVVWMFDATTTHYQLKNKFNRSTNPAKCGENDLCWARAKSQFNINFPPKVTVYVRYEFTGPITNDLGRVYWGKINNILLLKEITSKQIKFKKTWIRRRVKRRNGERIYWVDDPIYHLILDNNFLNEYGIRQKDCASITEILRLSEMPCVYYN